MTQPEGLAAASQRRVTQHPVLGALPEAPPVRITLDGQELQARAGEPLAAALLANGVRVFRTMPSNGEPRGPFCAVGRCTDCLMVVDGQLNVRACQTAVRDGMRVERQRGLGHWSNDR